MLLITTQYLRKAIFGILKHSDWDEFKQMFWTHYRTGWVTRESKEKSSITKIYFILSRIWFFEMRFSQFKIETQLLYWRTTFWIMFHYLLSKLPIDYWKRFMYYLQQCIHYKVNDWLRGFYGRSVKNYFKTSIYPFKSEVFVSFKTCLSKNQWE